MITANDAVNELTTSFRMAFVPLVCISIKAITPTTTIVIPNKPNIITTFHEYLHDPESGKRVQPIAVNNLLQSHKVPSPMDNLPRCGKSGENPATRACNYASEQPS